MRGLGPAQPRVQPSKVTAAAPVLLHVQAAGLCSWLQQQQARPVTAAACTNINGGGCSHEGSTVRTQEAGSPAGPESRELPLQQLQQQQQQRQTSSGSEPTASGDASHSASVQVRPHHVTRKIVAAGSVEELDAVVRSHRKSLNSVHVAAALVKLAKLCGPSRHGEGSAVTSNSSPGASQQQQQPQRVWHRPRRRRMYQAKDKDSGSAAADVACSRPGSMANLPLVQQLFTDLGRRYVQLAPDYSTARQHANVCWALGILKHELQLPPEQQVPTALESAVMASGAAVLQVANSQELSCMSLGLAYLGHYSPPLISAVCKCAGGKLPAFQARELSNFAWAVSHAYLHHQQHHQGGPALMHSDRLFPHEEWAHASSQQQQDAVDWGPGATSWRGSPAQTAAATEPHQQSGSMQASDASQQLCEQVLHSIDQVAQQACSVGANAFKPQELATLLWVCARLGRLNEHTRPLFAAALPVLQTHARAGKLNEQDVSNSVWAYAKLHLVEWGHQLLDAIAPMMLAPLHQRQQQQAGLHTPQATCGQDALQQGEASASPPTTQQGINSDQQAQQQQRHQHGRRKRQRLVLQRYGSQELGNVLWAVASLQYHQPGAYLASQLLLVLTQRRKQLSTQTLANISWAAARLGLQQQQPERTAVACSLADAPDLAHDPPQHVSNTLWACTSLPASICSEAGSSSELSSLATAGTAQVQGQDGVTPAGLAQLAWASGWAARQPHQRQPGRNTCAGAPATPHHKQQHSSSPAPQLEAAWSCGPGVDGTTLPQASQANSLTAAAGGEEQAQSVVDAAAWQALADRVSEAAHQQLSQLQPQELSVLAQGLSYAQRRAVDRALFTRLGDAALPHVAAGRFSPSGLANMLAAFVRAGVPHRQLAASAAQAVAARVEQYSAVQLANLVWALACMRVRFQPLLDRAAHSLLSGVLAHVPYTPRYANASPGPSLAAAAAQQASSQVADAPPPAAGASQVTPVPNNDGREDDDEDLAQAPRSKASSLLKQLGWEEAEEDWEEDEGPDKRASQQGAWHDNTDHGSAQGSMQRARPQQQPWPLPADLSAQADGDGGLADGAASAFPQGRSEAMAWTVLAWAFARCSYHQHQLYDKLAAAVLHNWQPGGHAANPAQPAPGSMVVNMSTPAAGADAVLPEASTPAPEPPPQQQLQQGQQVASSYQHALSSLSTNSLVQLVWAFALHDHSHPLLLQEAAPVLATRIMCSGLSSRQVATTAWAYAKLQQYEPLLFRAVLHQAMQHANRYSLRDWSRLAWAFSTLCLPAEEAFFVRLSQLQRQEAAVAQQRRASSYSPPPSSPDYSGGNSSSSSSSVRPAQRASAAASASLWSPMPDRSRDASSGPQRDGHSSYHRGSNAAGLDGGHSRRRTAGSSSQAAWSPPPARAGGVRSSTTTTTIINGSSSGGSLDEEEQGWLGRPQRAPRDLLLLSPAGSSHLLRPPPSRPSQALQPPSPPPPDCGSATQASSSAASDGGEQGGGTSSTSEGDSASTTTHNSSSAGSSKGVSASANPPMALCCRPEPASTTSTAPLVAYPQQPALHHTAAIGSGSVTGLDSATGVTWQCDGSAGAALGRQPAVGPMHELGPIWPGLPSTLSSDVDTLSSSLQTVGGSSYRTTSAS